MLSRIAQGLYTMGREIERAQNVIRILEVNHKMHLERESLEAVNVWQAIGDSFEVAVSEGSEAEIYDALVISEVHPFAVRRCIASAREQGRAMRDHISEEMWLHLNLYYLSLDGLSFDRVLAKGRSDFNREVEAFCDAFHGLADNTMIRGEPWHFLRIGKFIERACMTAHIVDVKRKTLDASPEDQDRPLDRYQWQALLRSVSGYEPYRRVYDARIDPVRVLDFVLRNEAFPRSIFYALGGLADSLRAVASSNAAQAELQRDLEALLFELRQLDGRSVLAKGVEGFAQDLMRRFELLSQRIDEAYFSSLRPAPEPVRVARGAGLVAQQ